MAEITKARTGELLRALFEILLEHPDGLRASAALGMLAETTKLTPYELEETRSGHLRYAKRLHFSTVNLARAGWLAKSDRTKWIVTEEGKRAFAKYTDPEAFYREAINRRMSTQWGSQQSPSLDQEPDSLLEGDEEEQHEAQITFDQADEQAWDEIEKHLRSMPPYDFQELVAALLRGMGYHVNWIAPPGKDGGVDIIAWTDPLGTRSPRLKVQVKRYKEGARNSVEELRSFLALLGDDDVGLFVTTGVFTKDALNLARSQEKRKVTLIDLEKFFDLWVVHYAKLDDSARRRFPLQPIYFLAPGN
jgi:restriction system protein